MNGNLISCLFWILPPLFFYTHPTVLQIDPPEQKIDDVSAEDFRNLMDLNVVGGFLAAKVSNYNVEAALPSCKAAGMLQRGKRGRKTLAQPWKEDFFFTHASLSPCS